MDSEYTRATEKLIARVCEIDRAEWSPTPARQECVRVAKALNEVADMLAANTQWMMIEAVHKARGEPEVVTGLDGWPQTEESEYEWANYEAIKLQIRELAYSARLAAEELPDPREKHALPHAAMGLLHLLHWYGFPPATAYKDGSAVIELERIARKAGILRSREAYLKALKQCMKNFDGHYTPPEMGYLFE